MGRKYNLIIPNNYLAPQSGNQVNSRNQQFNQVAHQNHLPNMRQSRVIYGASSTSVSALNFNEPISSGMGYTGNFMQPQQSFPHTIKPTSRKNRASNMPNLRNPSNTNIDMFQNNMMNNVPNSVNSQTRLNSLSSQNLNFQTRLRNTQQQTQQNIHSASFNNLNSAMRVNKMQHIPTNFNQQQSQQRQISSSSAANLGNVSMNTVVQAQLYPVGATSDIKTMPQLQQPQQQVPQQKQEESHLKLPTNAPIHLSTPVLSSSVPDTVESSPASLMSNNTSQSIQGGKSKKKKFSLFKKKDKK